MIWRQMGWPTTSWGSNFEELERMRRQMDLLSQGLTRGYLAPSSGVFPLTNVTEDQDKFYVRAELPGLKAEELDIQVTGNSVSIGGERKIPAEKKNAKYHRRERESGTFSRMITLPTQIDTAKVQASCVDGVLTVTLPKAAAAKPKQITVKAK